MTRMIALLSLLSALALPIFQAEAAGWAACLPDEPLRYRLDKDNVTGWRHDLSRPIPEEVAWFEDGDLVLERAGQVHRYITGGGGSGLRYRVGRATGLPEDDPAASIRYVFYDLSAIAAKGQPDQILMIDGDIFWPSCRPH